ncbi:hypothetical protein D9M71_548720 [compost metagenome]
MLVLLRRKLLARAGFQLLVTVSIALLAQKALVEFGWLDHPNHSTALSLWTTGAAQIQGGQQACGDPKAPFVMILQ